MLFPSLENSVIAHSPRPTIKASKGVTPISILVRSVVITVSSSFQSIDHATTEDATQVLM